MPKKKKGDIYEAKISDTKYITSDITAFSLEAPETFDRALEQLRESLSHPDSEPDLTPLEFLLRRLEDSARKILTKNGHPVDRDELVWLIDEHTYPISTKTGGSCLKCDLEIESLSARRVLLSALNLRDDIASKDAESAAIEMMRIMYAAVNMDGYKTLMRGIRFRTAQHRGAYAPKQDKRGYYFAIQEIFRLKGEKISRENMWRYLKRVHSPEINSMQVDDYEIWTIDDDKLYQRKNGDQKTVRMIS